MRIVGDAFKERKNFPTVKPIYLYSIKFNPTTNSFKRYTSFPSGVTFDGIDYEHYPIQHSEIKEDTTGKVQKSSLVMSNANREVQALADDNNGLRDREVTITQVWFETLNDPTAFISDTFFISNSVLDEKQGKFSLSSQLDVLDIRLPRRIISGTFCRFAFKDGNCGYVGEELTCNKTIQRCRELDIVERFGAFPTTPLQQIVIGAK